MEVFIRNILKMSIKDEVIDKILSTSFFRFKAAFTSKYYDPEENYEFFEQLGDLSINKFIVTYMGTKFPQLRSSNGVGVLASLRILYGSKDVLSGLSEKYGMDKYILCTQEELVDKNKFRSVLEDVFEAFFGALEYSIDVLYYKGLGYVFVYDLLTKMFDDIDISIDYESLVDAKTRLNELKDEHKINIRYKDTRLLDGTFSTELYVEENLAGVGFSNIKKNSQIMAASEALEWISKNLKIKKEIPERYKTISKTLW